MWLQNALYKQIFWKKGWNDAVTRGSRMYACSKKWTASKPEKIASIPLFIVFTNFLTVQMVNFTAFEAIVKTCKKVFKKLICQKSMFKNTKTFLHSGNPGYDCVRGVRKLKNNFLTFLHRITMHVWGHFLNVCRFEKDTKLNIKMIIILTLYILCNIL